MTLEELRESIEAVVEYLWVPEKRDFWELAPEDRRGHIYLYLIELRNFLEGESE